MQSNPEWVETILRAVVDEVERIMQREARSFMQSLQRWFDRNWPNLGIDNKWEVNLRRFLASWSNTIELEPTSRDQLFAWLRAWADYKRAEAA
jgi:hypothetical protein